MAPKAKSAPAAAKSEAKPKAKAAAKKQDRPEDLIEKVEAPNDQEFQAKTDAINREIEKLQEEVKEISAQIKERSGGKDEYHQQRKALLDELAKWNQLLDEKHAQQKEFKTKLEGSKQESQDQKQALQNLTRSMKFTTEREIDNRLAEIEYKMHTEHMPLKEEKKLMLEIAELKKHRPKLAKCSELQQNISSDDRGLPFKEKIKETSEAIRLLMTEKGQVSEKLKALTETRSKDTGDLPDLIQKRTDHNAKIQECIQKRTDLRAERKQQESNYWKYQQELREIRQQRAVEERQKRQEEYDERRRAREADKLEEQPYVAEITLVEQSISFCRNLIQEKSGKEQEEKKEIKHTNKPEEVVLLNKNDREEEFYFAPTKGKKAKSKAKEDKSSGAKPIKHDAGTFQLFHKLKLDAPITTEDVPPLLEKLEAQLEDYKTKVKVWEEKKEEMKRKILAGEVDVEEKDEAVEEVAE